MATSSTAPYGSWVSPINSDLVVEDSISVKEVKVDPFQKGRNVKTFRKRAFV